MRQIWILAIACTMICTSCAQDKKGPALTGRYVGTQNFGEMQFQSTLVIEITSSDGKIFNGTVTPAGTEGTTVASVQSTSLSGNKFRFDVKDQILESPATLRYEGTLTADQLTGLISLVACVDPPAASPGEECADGQTGHFLVTRVPDAGVL